jgi:hypothetical protein
MHVFLKAEWAVVAFTLLAAAIPVFAQVTFSGSWRKRFWGIAMVL